ncbi:HAD family hydrolase [Radiobacillus sp. PE A8.2]|uniref:HAD family hydrolase n=1 Tax=Radiobacillus sp. PE A8.2 TaxID=3380349 RepID=UPI003890809C
MKAFASDLDRTLIYSQRMINSFPFDKDFHLIETLDGREISFISSDTKENIKRITKSAYFIPVTTRTIEQYHRITLFQDEIKPEYAVTHNGALIIKDGKPLEEWTLLVKEKLQSYMSIDDMLKQVQKLNVQKLVKRIRKADQFFFYFILNKDGINQLDFLALKDWLKNYGWQTSLQGRKLYFIPNPINKWSAIDFLREKLSLNEVYAAGDSLLDCDLIAKANYGLSPKHGEVLEHFPTIESTTSVGMKASEEITEVILKKLINHPVN